MAARRKINMNRSILIKTCQKFHARRRAVAATWAQELYARDQEVWFVEGGHPQTTVDRVQRLIQAASGDEYNDNSLKVSAALQWLLEKTEFNQLFIVDDDTFVHPRRWLQHEPVGQFECRIYRPQSERDRRLNYGRPWALGGGGWWMSRGVCHAYVSEITARCSYDDVLATRVAQDNNIPITDRPELYGGDSYVGECDRVGPDNHFITSHHICPEEMRKLYEATKGI